MDGTFSVAPSQWTQVFCIGCYVKERIVICAHCLLPGKKSKYYKEALEAIKNAIEPGIQANQQINPQRIISDFEKSILKATKQCFPHAKSNGCNFHFGQSLFRKAKKLGIFNLFDDDNYERKRVYKIFRY